MAAFFVYAACGGSEASNPTPLPSPTATPVRSATPRITPTTAPSATALPGGFEYTIQLGDTLGDIAQRFGVTVESIVATNGIEDPAAIIAGQVILITSSSYIPTATPSPTPEPENPVGTGFQMPVAGACLPSGGQLMPNAPREYRAGIHEGVDFYTGYNCVEVPAGSDALAAAEGTIIRADHNYVPLTLDELDELLSRSLAQGYTDAEALDRFRGRQVWIDHGDGIVTRYGHLQGIPADVHVGDDVRAGDIVGFVGDSGTPESVTAPGVEIHLHFEVRVGNSFLGAGLPIDQVRYLYEQVFSGS